jgi:ABC-type nitrate/sulfonate/bicarbonate transport system substrate-binding protein
MNVVADIGKHAEIESPLTEAVYTICPVFVASGIAVEFGWLEEEFKRVGAHATYLRSLGDNAGWLPHFTHGLPNLFREGGAIPAIHAKADLTDTKLVGLTWVKTGGQILARADAGLHRAADLKGRRIGLYRSLNKTKVDFRRATAERGILLALELAGLSRKDVEIVDIDDAETPIYKPAKNPGEYLAQGRQKEKKSDPELEALDRGRVDAIYGGPGRSENLVDTGKYTIIEDLARYPDWTLHIANSPFTNAVSSDLAHEHPEIVVAFLRASIRAGRWINDHRAAAADIFTRITSHQDARAISRFIADADFVPQLSARNLAALEVQKNFLRDHGYIEKDFDVRDWADDSFLTEALRSL